MSDLQTDRKPLLEKLEPQHHHSQHAFNREAQAWSKTGRDMAQMLIDLFKDFFDF
jgi:hypothetical protein